MLPKNILIPLARETLQGPAAEGDRLRQKRGHNKITGKAPAAALPMSPFEIFFRSRLEEAFSSARHKARKHLKEAVFYSLFAPSGLFRARLAQAAAESLGADPKSAFPWAAAVEMAHSASLLHDDLPSMDNGQSRRGKKCAHLVFGEDIALLAGTCLFVEAFALLADPALAEPGRRRGLLRLFVSKTGFHGLMSGQAMDLRLSMEGSKKPEASAANRPRAASDRAQPGAKPQKPPQKKPKSAPPPFFLDMIRLKTGSLIEAAVEGPLLLWGQSPAERSALKKYSRALGLAYQMADDLIDGDSPLKSPQKTKALLIKFTEESLKALQPLEHPPKYPPKNNRGNSLPGGRAGPLKALSLENQKRALKISAAK